MADYPRAVTLFGSKVWWPLGAGLFLQLIACSAAPPVAPKAQPDMSAPRRPARWQPRVSDEAPQPSGSSPPSNTTPGAALPTGPAPVSSASFGTEAPLTVFAANASPTWVGFCQVRADTDANGVLEVHAGAHGEPEGDRLSPLLADPAAKETSIERFLGSGAQGRYVAYVRAGKIWLYDAYLGELRAVSEWDASHAPRQATWPPAAFDRQGTSFAFVVGDGSHDEVAIFDLATHTERRFSAGAGKIWNLDFEPDGAFLRVESVSVDSNGNGRLDGPLPSSDNPACRAPIPNYNVRQNASDAVGVALYSLKTNSLRALPDFVATLGSAIITRGHDRELFLETESGVRSILTSPSCNARLLHLDAARQSLVFGCAKTAGERRALYFRFQDKTTDLKLDAAAFETDTRIDDNPTWLPLSAHEKEVLLDLANGELTLLPEGTTTIATANYNALVEREGKLLFLTKSNDVKPHRVVETELGKRRPSLVAVQRRGTFIALGSDLFDLAAAKWVGSFERTPLVLSSEGLGLIPRKNASPPKFALGTLRWMSAMTQLP